MMIDEVTSVAPSKLFGSVENGERSPLVSKPVVSKHLDTRVRGGRGGKAASGVPDTAGSLHSHADHCARLPFQVCDQDQHTVDAGENQTAGREGCAGLK